MNGVAPHLKVFCIFFLLLIASCNGGTADKEQNKWNGLSGKVVGIADGDTFTLLTEEKKQVKVRLYGIDCPERAQEFGNVARQKLSDLIFQNEVQVVEKEVDRYKRVVGVVYSDNTCINEELLREGLAWHYKEYDDNPAWTRLEEKARKQRIGLWSQPNPVAPWEWRKEKRSKAKNKAKART